MVFSEDSFLLAEPIVTKRFLNLASAVKYISKHRSTTYGCYVYVLLARDFSIAVSGSDG